MDERVAVAPPPEPLTAVEAAEPAAAVTAAPAAGGRLVGLLDRLGLGGGLLGRWTKILSAYFSAQSLVQLLGIGAGLLFINFMPVEQYALYTLAFSVVSFFHFLTDLGSTGSLVYFFHKTAKEGGEFDGYVAAVESLRRWAFLLGGLGVLAIFPWTARAEGFGLVESLLVAGGILLAVGFQISGSIRVLALRLADRYGLSYKAEMAGGAVRLALAALLVGLALLPAWLAVLTAAAAAATVAWTARSGKPDVPPDLQLGPYRRRVLRYLTPTLPSALYFSIQAPLVVWLAATFGGTRNIAEVGALGRLGMIIGLFSGLAGVVYLPRMARITDDRLYRRRYVQYGASLLAVALALLAGAWLVPDLFLFLLGENYAGLHRELFLVVAGAGLTLLGGYAVGVNHARSWNRWQGAAVGVLVAAQVLFVALLPLGTTAGVLTFNLLSAAVGLALQLGMTWVGFVRPRWVAWT